MLHGVLWEKRRNDRIQFRTPAAPGSRTITARATRFLQQRWADALGWIPVPCHLDRELYVQELALLSSGPGGAF
jgi:hypothetical protein